MVALTGAMLEARALYRAWLDDRFRNFTLAGLVADDELILLRQIYVPLRISDVRLSDDAPEHTITQRGQSIERWLANDKVASPRPQLLVLSGEAGSGKTTLALLSQIDEVKCYATA